MEKILEVINRLSALLEQYDAIENALAQVEMQREVAYRVSDKDMDSLKNQVAQGIEIYSSQKEAADRALFQITGVSLGELRTRLLDIKVLFNRYNDINSEYTKIRKAYDIIAEANAFDEEEGEGASRKEFDEQLTRLKVQKDITFQHLTRILNGTINKSPIVGAVDSVISKLHNQDLIIQ